MIKRTEYTADREGLKADNNINTKSERLCRKTGR